MDDRNRWWKKILPVLLVIFLAAGSGITVLADGREAAETVSTTEKRTVVRLESGAAQSSGDRLESGDASDAGVSYLWMSGSSNTYERRYGDQLTGVSRELYNKMVSTWGKGKTGDLMYKLSDPYEFQSSTKSWRTSKEYEAVIASIDKVVQSAYDAFIYDYPEVFWLSTVQYYSGLSLKENGSKVEGTVKNVVLQCVERYSGAGKDVSKFQNAVSKVAARIRNLAPSDSRYALVKEIHDYLCDNLSYGDNTDPAEDYAHTAAGVFLKEGVVVCEGYAKAFKILCDQYDIPCVLIVGYTDEPHMWNYVKMDDGQWYLVDVTWDDRDEGMTYAYFLVGSKSIGLDGETVGSQRIAYTDFSGSNAKSFILPKLTAREYESETRHSWKKVSSTAGTCLAYKKVTYQCRDCGLEKTEVLDKTGHSWGTYKSNHDATCLADGTKTAKCKYGCGKTKTVTDTGSKLKATITLNVSSLRLQKGQTTTKVKVSGLAKGDSVVSWKSSVSSIATVKKKGKLGVQIKAKKVGTATITVTLKSGLKKTFQIRVQNTKVKTEKITGVAKSLTLKKGKTVQISPVLSPLTSQEKITYSSSDKKTATVSSGGVIQAKKKGTVTITIRSGSITKKCKVTVK